MLAPGRVPRRPWELAGATAGALQVCPRNVTFGGPWVVRSAGRRVNGLHLGLLLCLGAGVREPVCPWPAICVGAAARCWSFSERIH